MNNPSAKVTLVGVTLLFTLTGCPRVCPDVVHQFAITSTSTPEKDSIQVGDTLLLSSTFSTLLTDVSSGQTIDYTHALSIGSDVFIQELPTDKSPIEDAVDSFLFLSLKGRIYNSDQVGGSKGVNQLTYQQTGPNYELLVGFVPKHKGTFCLTTGNGLSTGRVNQSCDKASFEVRLANTNQHLYYLENYLGMPPSSYSAQKAYCFKVY